MNTAGRFLPQPATALVLSMIALLPFIQACGGRSFFVGQIDLFQSALLLFCGSMLCVAHMYPIHIQQNMKVVLTTIPLFVIVSLAPPLEAALVAGSSMLLAQLLTRATHGNTPSDMATICSRSSVIAFVSATTAWYTYQHTGSLTLQMGCTALVMFVGDVVTGSLEIAPMMGVAPRQVIRIVLRETPLAEGVQYCVGMLVVLASMDAPWSLVLWIVPTVIVYRSFKYAKEVHDTTHSMLISMADAVDLRDAYTGGHSRRVTEYTVRILRALDMRGPEVDLIISAARVHDIGKIGIPDVVLNKPGMLTMEERVLMDSHAERGAALLARHHDFARGVAIIRHHHERWDGAGYPDGLTQQAIPFGARVIAVADSFDAMTSDRPYRRGMNQQHAIAILQRGRGQQWDAQIVDALLRALA